MPVDGAESAEATGKPEGDGAEVDESKSKPEEKKFQMTKTAIVNKWLDSYRDGESAASNSSRSPYVLKGFMLKLESLMLDEGHKDPCARHSWELLPPKSIVTKLELKNEHKSPTTYFFGGNVTLKPTPLSYQCCSLAAWKFYVDGSSDCGYPYLAWAVPATDNDDETTLELVEVIHTIRTGNGRASQTIQVTFQALQLKEMYNDMKEVVLVRPLLECEKAEKARSRAKPQQKLSYLAKLTAALKPKPATPDGPEPGTTGSQSGRKRNQTEAGLDSKTEKNFFSSEKKAKTAQASKSLGTLAGVLEDCVDKKTGDIILGF